jgi:hypothetical protein
MTAMFKVVSSAEIAASPGHRLDAGYYLRKEAPVTIRVTNLAPRERYVGAGPNIGWHPSEGWSWVALGSRWRTNQDGEGLWRWAVSSATWENYYEWKQVLGTGQFSIRRGSQSRPAVRARIRTRFAKYEEITP